MTPDQRLLANVAGFLAGVVLLIAGGAWAGYAWRDRSATADLAECQRVHTEALAVTLRAAQQAEAAYRQQETQTAAAHQESMHVTLAHLETARDDAARARAALERLRRAAAAAPSDRPAADRSAASGDIPPAGAFADLHAELLAGIGAAALAVGEEADRYRAAGEGCERDYAALKPSRLGEAR